MTKDRVAHYLWKRIMKRSQVGMTRKTSKYQIRDIASPGRVLFRFGVTIAWTHTAPAYSHHTMTTGQDAPWLSAHDPATCTRKGLCPVTQSEDQGRPLESHSLYFEQHGTGPVKVVFIAGRASCQLGLSSQLKQCLYRLNVSSNMWAGQVKYLSRLPQYSILVFDNRGVGNSDTPKGPYSSVLSSAAPLDRR